MQLSEYKVPVEHINYNNIFLLSDLHFGVRANSLEWLKNHESFFKNHYIPFLKANKKDGDILFILGDWFDNRQLLDIYVMNTSIDIVLELADILPVYFLTGNHDIYKKYDTDVNSIIAFKYIPNVHVYEKPVIITNKTNKILVLPWVGNKDLEETYLRANKFDYVFAHADIGGFQYDNGREIKTAIAADFLSFKNIKRMFSGHIHKRQELDRFIYIGSPFHTKRSDIGNKKGYYVFNSNENTYQFFNNDFSPVFQRITLEYLLEQTLDNVEKLLDNNYTDIIVPDKYVHLFNLTKFIDVLKECSYKKIETISERKKIDDDLTMMEGVDITDILTLLEMSITDLGDQMETLVKLKVLNKNYYEKASKDFTE